MPEEISKLKWGVRGWAVNRASVIYGALVNTEPVQAYNPQLPERLKRESYKFKGS